MLALYLIGLAAGRIVTSVLGGSRPGVTIAVASAATCLVAAVFYLVPLGVWALWLLAFVLGLGVGPLLPFVIASAGLRYRSTAGTAMGMVKLAIPVGGILIPGLVGLLSDAVSFSLALYVFPLSAAVVFVSTLVGERRTRREGSPESHSR
jgi:MFS family permease